MSQICWALIFSVHFFRHLQKPHIVIGLELFNAHRLCSCEWGIKAAKHQGGFTTQTAARPLTFVLKISWWVWSWSTSTAVDPKDGIFCEGQVGFKAPLKDLPFLHDIPLNPNAFYELPWTPIWEPLVLGPVYWYCKTRPPGASEESAWLDFLFRHFWMN